MAQLPIRLCTYPLLSLVFLIPFVVSQNTGWVNPGDFVQNHDYSNDPRWQIGSTQTLVWDSPYQTATITLDNQHYSSTDETITLAESVVGFQYVWVVNVSSFDLSASSIARVFYFGVNTSDSSGSSAAVLSHYINITDASAITTSSSTTSSVSTSSTTSVSSTGSTRSTPVQSISSTKSKSLGGGVIAGIVIGSIAALAALLAALGWFIWIFRRNRQSIGSSEMQTTPWQRAELDGGTGSNNAYKFEKRGPLVERHGGLHELEAHEGQHEMSG